MPAGGRIVAPEDCYFGVGELLADAQERWAVDRVDLTDTASVRAAVSGANMLWLETPSNPLLEVADLPALCAAGRHAGAIVGVDNTFATPLLQQPLAFGADLVVHSATLRGLRTLALRLDRGQANAGELARRLASHPAVSRVRTSSSTPPAWAASKAPSSGAASSPGKNTCPPGSCA